METYTVEQLIKELEKVDKTLPVQVSPFEVNIQEVIIKGGYVIIK